MGVIDARGRRIIARGPAQADTLFEIGSITKTFTGLLLADMVARGEVGLNVSAAKYLPAGWTLPVRGRPITLLDLTTHRSGLPRVSLNMPYSDEGKATATILVCHRSNEAVCVDRNSSASHARRER